MGPCGVLRGSFRRIWLDAHKCIDVFNFLIRTCAPSVKLSNHQSLRYLYSALFYSHPGNTGSVPGTASPKDYRSIIAGKAASARRRSLSVSRRFSIRYFASLDGRGRRWTLRTLWSAKAGILLQSSLYDLHSCIARPLPIRCTAIAIGGTYYRQGTKGRGRLCLRSLPRG